MGFTFWTPNNMSIVRRTHDCYEHYELKSYEKLFSCDGCKMKGFGQRYICNLCGHELHQECRFPKTETTHEYFGCSIFTFREKPFTRTDRNNKKEYSKCCDACGKDICGFSYHCEADNLDLHPCCCKLQEKLLIDDTMFDRRANVSSKCMWCKKRKISDGQRDVPGWSYISTCKKYHLHVYCMTEMMHEAYMKNGDLALEKVDFKHLVKSKRMGGSRSTTFETIKSFLKIILAALLGDPTMLISNVLVELVTRGLQ
ncbi:hypothetical protein BUALT_Bualt10G0042100 [Buddleja alternifolia]|uniref:Phorbol-ester/DAG-type domain-containing protein n=1 Tax=Buddleja alternifolia TaxID=168488 RepID=A0AAV6WWS8_9LAMI|nr:hypothetical protein BUALT_Bualt10G0042100 [Buddleja alternifolia]